jgi:hypothetical protein
MYVYTKISKHRWEKKEKEWQLLVHWRNAAEEEVDPTWEPINNVSQEDLDAYLNNSEVSAEDNASMRQSWKDTSTSAIPQAKTRKSRKKPTDAESKDEKKKVVNEIHTEAETEKIFNGEAEGKATYFVLPSNGGKSEMVMTKRKGKFTEKVKAIRALLVQQADALKDTELREMLVQQDTPFTARRHIRFPLDPQFDYSGKPWFSLNTSVAEPNTEILHTDSCRNVLDTKLINAPLRNEMAAARTFADFEVMLWDFDLIIKHRIFLNAKFKFCKECKEYTNVFNPKHTGDASLDAFIETIRANKARPAAKRLASPPRVPSVRSAANSGSSISSRDSSSKAHSDSGSSSTAWSAGSSTKAVTLRTIHKNDYPLTDLVSYFALHASLVDLA